MSDKNKITKKKWTKPELTEITGFNVHESVVAISVTPWGSQSSDEGQSPIEE